MQPSKNKIVLGLKQKPINVRQILGKYKDMFMGKENALFFRKSIFAVSPVTSLLLFDPIQNSKKSQYS